MKTLKAAIACGLAAALLSPGPAAAHHEPRQYRRAYLLADSGDFLWWSFDPLEHDANLRLVERFCPHNTWGYPQAKPCLTGTSVGGAGAATQSHLLWFSPVSRIADTASWSATSPLRFRFALEVETPAPAYTVHLAMIQAGSGLRQSPAATQVAPGVYEGTLAGGSPLGPGAWVQLAVEVRFPHPSTTATLRLRTDGTSYVEFPEAVGGYSLSDLRDLSPDAASPDSFSTETKRFWFNDDNWEVRSFQGDLDQTRSFPHTLDRTAAAVFGWVEADVTDPFVYHAVREGEADPDTTTSRPRVALVNADGEIDHGSASSDGSDSVAAIAVPPGQLDLQVTRVGDATGYTYRAYLLVVYGDRTLQGMRTRFNVATAARVPSVATCPGTQEPIPVASLVRAFTVDIDWDSVNPLTKWSPRYSTPIGDAPCGEEGTGDRVTFVTPGERVFWLGATPSKTATFASFRDTIIEAHVRFWYEPPPHPVEEPPQAG